jgi:hypothetical protein
MGVPNRKVGEKSQREPPYAASIWVRCECFRFLEVQYHHGNCRTFFYSKPLAGEAKVIKDQTMWKSMV